MVPLKTLVEKIRSKNAGPFWITLDVFCHSDGSMPRLAAALTNAKIAQLFQIDESQVKRFELTDLNVIKVSFPRPTVQGTVADRDMHGAAFAHLLEELQVSISAAS